ncbi:hypothetical protein EQZ23_06880 [Sphingomonas sp. UV9]|uniref:hypothetical protein n=1 Tax=Sphingomonas sp. UV9 TaxID=1851410 RepID=UPI000FFC7CEC|nr:hypothetical protein [Sphingomonas sp. UV9]RXD04860.1 hypothetical protein EQZ23_06880 [Sphingomonas sp. UV9]
MVRKPNCAAPKIVVGMTGTKHVPAVPRIHDGASIAGREVSVYGNDKSSLMSDRPCSLSDRSSHAGDYDHSVECVGSPGDGPWREGVGDAGSRDRTSEYESIVTLAADGGSPGQRVSISSTPSPDDSGKMAAATDIKLVVDRLMSHVDDAGLLGGEVEGLLGLNIGQWLIYRTGRPAGSMTPAQHDRARLTVEMLDLLSDRHRTWPAVVAWLIRPSSTLDDLTPLEWASESAEHLHAVVRALREFAL